jgi:hypothetical protein
MTDECGFSHIIAMHGSAWIMKEESVKAQHFRRQARTRVKHPASRWFCWTRACMWCKMPEVSCGLSEMIGKHGEYKNPGLCHCVVDRQEFAVYSGGAGEMVRPA